MKVNLSNREIEVLKLVADEKTSLQISEELELSKRTIDRHRYNICKKIGVSGNNSLIQYSLKNREAIFKLRLNK